MLNKDKIQFKMPVQVSWCTVNFPFSQESLCGTGDLSHVTSLEVCVDTQENTLGNFGKLERASRHLHMQVMAYCFKSTAELQKFECVLTRALCCLYNDGL